MTAPIRRQASIVVDFHVTGPGEAESLAHQMERNLHALGGAYAQATVTVVIDYAQHLPKHRRD